MYPTQSLCDDVRKAFEARFRGAKFFARIIGNSKSEELAVHVHRLSGWVYGTQARELAKSLEQPDPITDLGPGESAQRVRHIFCQNFIESAISQPVLFQVLETDADGESLFDMRIWSRTWDKAMADHGTPEEAFAIIMEKMDAEVCPVAVDELRSVIERDVEEFQITIRLHNERSELLGAFEMMVPVMRYKQVETQTTLAQLHDWYIETD